MNNAKKLFWEAVRAIEGAADVAVYNEHGVVVEVGMVLDNDMSINYKLDDGTVALYDGEVELIDFGECDYVLTAFAELLAQISLIRPEKRK